MHTRPSKEIRTAIPKRPFPPLVLCFIGPLIYDTNPPYIILAIATAAAVAAFVWSLGKDAFTRERFPEMLVWILCLKALGFSFLSTPSLPSPDPISLGIMLVYLILIWLIPLKAAKRVGKLEAEYFAYSQPSKQLLVDVGVRHGEINRKEADLKWTAYVQEGLSYKRMTRVANLLIHEAVGVLALFLLFGIKDGYMLGLSLVGTLAISVTLTRMISKPAK